MNRITSTERRLIDEAIAEGRVTVIPQGVTTLDRPIPMREQIKQLWRGQRGRGKDLVKRDQYRALVAAGHTRAEIAAVMGVNYRSALAMLNKLGLDPVKEYEKGRKNGPIHG